LDWQSLPLAIVSGLAFWQYRLILTAAEPLFMHLLYSKGLVDLPHSLRDISVLDSTQ
jgi:hypothetical protein